MNIFSDKLKVCFFLGNKIILKREDSEFVNANIESKLTDDGSLYLDLNNDKDKIILDLIMKSDSIQLDFCEYKVLEKNFIIDGTALFVSLAKI